MKDPLQKKETPYEILGVPITADKKEIDNAFKRSLSSGRNVSEITQAWKTLCKPVDRAFVDVFLYNENFITQLNPDIWNDNSQLLSRRAEIAQSWRNVQKEFFPNFPSTHSLAILWYWWTVYCEEEQWAFFIRTSFEKKENLSTPFPLHLLWSYTISNWVFLINSDDFWSEWMVSRETTRKYLGNEDIKALAKFLESHFINLFHNFYEKYLERGDQVSAKRYKEYELLFNTEMKTAQKLSRAGVQLSRGRRLYTISCGRMMLEHVGMLGSVQEQLERIIQNYPENEELRKLADSLSPHFSIAVLIDENKFDEAIKEIKKLPLEEQGKEEILRLLAKSYLYKGKQLFSLNKYEDALDCWEKGLDTGQLGEELKDAIVSNCKTVSASLQNNDPETAIMILEKALKLVKNKELQLILGQILNQQGVLLINEAQRKLESKKKDSLSSVINEVEKGISYFERAANLGFEQASQNLKAAIALLKIAKSGFFNLPPEVSRLVQEANEVIEKTGKFEEGIRILKTALEKTEGQAKTYIKKLIAQYLNAFAVQKVNSAMEKINSVMEKHQKEIGENVQKFLKSGGESNWGCFLALFLILILPIFIFSYIKVGLNKALKIAGWLIFLMIIFAPFIDSLINIIKRFFTSVPTIPLCSLCSRRASYRYNLPDYGDINLCDVHNDKLRSILEAPPKIDNLTLLLIFSAKSDLEEAVGLDPEVEQAKQNLKYVNDLIAQLKLR